MGNIVVNLHRNSEQDMVSVSVGDRIQERRGLFRELPAGYETKSLLEVLQYMCNPEGDEINDPYSPLELEVLDHLRPIVTDRSNSTIYAVVDGEIDDTNPLDLATSIDQYAPSIYSSRTMNLRGEPEQYKLVELIASKRFEGGYRT
ncbi:MAG: hypothetical protein ACOCWQ_05060 [Nanoarchaeota archaeon]